MGGHQNELVNAQKKLTEMTPSTLNKTAFPLNRRKRLLNSPNSPYDKINNPNDVSSQQRKPLNELELLDALDNIRHSADEDSGSNYTCSTPMSKNKIKLRNQQYQMLRMETLNNKTLNHDFKVNLNINSDSEEYRETDDCEAGEQYDIDASEPHEHRSQISSYNRHRTCKSDVTIDTLTKTSSQSNNSSLHKNVSLRRSTGLLNLSIEASPTTQRIINNSSKNDEMLKSFNELTFSNSNNDLCTGSNDNNDKKNHDPSVSIISPNFSQPNSNATTSSDLNSIITPLSSSNSNSNSISSAISKKQKNKHSNIFSNNVPHNNTLINHHHTAITNSNRRTSDMQKKLERKLEMYKDKISNATHSSIKKISPKKKLSDDNLKQNIKNENTNVQVKNKNKNNLKNLNSNQLKKTPFNFNKLVNRTKISPEVSNNDIDFVMNDDGGYADIDIDIDIENDDNSPSKIAFKKQTKSNLNNSRPFTTGSLLNNSISSIAMDSSSSSLTTNNSTSMVPPTNITPNLTSLSSNSFATPSFFKSTKPLQTAFTSTGLQSKIGMANSRRLKNTMPDTPCKRPPKIVNINNSRSSNIQSAPPTSIPTSASASNTSPAHVSISLPQNSINPINQNTILKSSTPNSSFNSFANDSSYAKNMSNVTANTSISKHNISNFKKYIDADPHNMNDHNSGNTTNSSNINNKSNDSLSIPLAVNTSDLQQCLMKFSNEFDDFTNLSIFVENDNKRNKNQKPKQGDDYLASNEDVDDEMWDEFDKVPTTPNYKSKFAMNLSSIQSNRNNSTMNTPESFNSLNSTDSPNSGKLDTPTKHVNYVNKFTNLNNLIQNSMSTSTGKTISSSSSSYWQRANSRNTSVQSLNPRNSTSSVNLVSHDNSHTCNALPVFAPPKLPRSLNISVSSDVSKNNTSRSNDSPHTPVEFDQMKNHNPLMAVNNSRTSVISDNFSSTSMQLCDSKSTFENSNYRYESIESTDTLVPSNHNGMIAAAKKNPELDENLISKFGNCTLLGKGEFSIVYGVQFQGVKYAVKRTKQKIPGPKTRLRKLEEVEILKSLRRVGEFNDENGDADFDVDVDLGNAEINNDGRDYVLTLISAWETQNHLYIMTDYCENKSLDQFLINECESSRSRLDEWRVWKILGEVMMGLKWIHSHNILHLDLKPANIFITFDGTLKIGDFGVSTKLPISTFFDREGDREYIAPEIISKHEYTFAADIFSVGLIMVEVAANVILPDNGTPWQKLRSGDLTDAGKLSSSDLSECIRFNGGVSNSTPPTTTTAAAADNKHFNNSLFSSTYDSVGTVGTDVSNSSNVFGMKWKNTLEYSNSMDEAVVNCKKIEYWTPYWFYDGNSILDKVVSWMINPNPDERPTSEQILRSYECGLVELRSKSGATIYEGDYGPAVSRDELENEKAILKARGSYKLQSVLR